jgi:hypothetical protein
VKQARDLPHTDRQMKAYVRKWIKDTDFVFAEQS